MVKQTLYKALRKAPCARLFLLFSIGILLGFYLPITAFLFQLLSGSIVGLALGLVAIECLGRRRYRRLSISILYIFLVLGGMFCMARQLPEQQEDYFSDRHADHIIGVITDEPVTNDKWIRFPLQMSHAVQNGKVESVIGQVIVQIRRGHGESEISYAYGDRLLLRNKITEVPPAYNPKQFNYQRYLRHQNIYHQVFLESREVQCIESNAGNSIIAYALKMRVAFVEKFTRFIPDPEALSIASALLFGYRANFQEETLNAFVHTGTIHVLSVSGLHVGLVFYLLHFLLGFLSGLPYGKILRIVLILSAIWCYVLLTGMAPPILRSGLMISFLLVAEGIQRSHQNLNSLFASACFLLFLDPFMLFDTGFQLSYLAVFGLFTYYPLLSKVFKVRHKLLRLFLQAIFVSLSAQLLTTPLVLYYFHQFPNYFLLGNLFVSIPTTILMYTGIILAVCPFAWLNHYLGMGMNFLCQILLKGLKAIDHFPHSISTGIHLSPFELILFFLVIISLLIACQVKHKGSLWCALFCSLLLEVFSVLSALGKASYRGVKIYNLGYDLAIGVIDHGRVALISSLDSLGHARLNMQVIPDLQQYAPMGEIQFYQLPMASNQFTEIASPLGCIGLVTGAALSKFRPSCDILLIRSLQEFNEDSLQSLSQQKVLIFDASNNDKVLEELPKKHGRFAAPFYILKNNFAYVWEEK